MSHQYDEAFMRMALLEAKRAGSIGEVPVGAVLVGKGLELITSSHNLCETTFDPTAHAEINAIRDSAKKLQNIRITETTLYVTLEPCAMCMGAIVHARIRRLVFGARDEKSGAAGSIYEIGIDRKLNHKIEVSCGVLNRECSSILKGFFGTIRTRNSSSL